MSPMLILLDLSAAFDTTDHSILLHGALGGDIWYSVCMLCIYWSLERRFFVSLNNHVWSLSLVWYASEFNSESCFMSYIHTSARPLCYDSKTNLVVYRFPVKQP